MDTIEIKRSEYDELTKRPTAEQLAAAEERAEKAEKEQEKLEADKVKAEQERDTAKTELARLEEQAREVTLRDERLGKLGSGFTAALGDKTKERLTAQAAKLSDDDWTARLEELEELTGKKAADETASKKDDGPNFTGEELARFNGGGGSGDDKKPDESVRRSVLAGLTS